MEIPVYVFVGFLDAGKTKFMQGTLEDERFNAGERTLVLLCEEGEEELDPSRFPPDSVFIETIGEREDLTAFTLSSLADKYRAERVIVEYNGMWAMDDLYAAMPEDWSVYQQFMFADAATFITYNDNMRQLMVDKMRGSEMIVLNRTAERTDKDMIHKIIRGVSRRCDILFEYPDGRVEPDDREDPLPFDLTADVVAVEDRDYAIWYREITEDPKKYVGKVFKIKGMIVKNPEIPQNGFAFGRHVMTCCVQDIQFAGMMAAYDGAGRLPHKGWAYVTAEYGFGHHPVYGGDGPLLYVRDVAMTSPPAEPVATFY